MQEKVEPGQEMAYSEEFLPGNGTYDDGTRIRAALYGESHVNQDTMELEVRPRGEGVPSIERGDIVFGEITYMKEDLASVKIVAVRGKEGRSMLQSVDGTLHVAKADKGYVKSLADLYQTGDIIRAKVVGLRGGPQLATDSHDFGVVQARSHLDQQVLVKEGNKLVHPETGRPEKRKFVSDYGSGLV